MKRDFVTIEEPLEIRSTSSDGSIIDQSISVTMRTPGNYFELALGFLLGEGIVQNPSDIVDIKFADEETIDKGLHNVVRVILRAGISFDPDTLTRHFHTTSSYGVCGKSSLEAIEMQLPRRKASGIKVSHNILYKLPGGLRNKQREFEKTGGLHAAATFTKSGSIERVREDVGRHNAVDKLVGHHFCIDG